MPGKDFDSRKIDNYFKGSHSAEDEFYMDQIFNDNNSEKDLKNLLSKQFDELPAEDKDIKNLDHLLHRIHYSINLKQAESSGLTFENLTKWTLRLTGILVLPLLILAGIQTYKVASLKKEAYIEKETWVEIKAPAWTRAQFSLPDGTTGWLNSNSSVKYNGAFMSDRQVTLKGEAYFDVFKDKSRPFVVKTDDVILRVLGTRFNIASYDNEKTVEVVLEEGSLIFNDKEMKQHYSMIPNDMVIYNKSLKDFKTEIVQPQKYLLWTEGKLVFRNDPLDVIARRMERWYNIDVEVNVKLSEGLRLRATFIDDNLEEVLALLKRSLPIDYKILNGNLKPDDTHSKKKVILLPRTY